MDPDPSFSNVETVVATVAFVLTIWYLFAIEASAGVAAVASMAVPFASIYLARFARRLWLDRGR